MPLSFLLLMESVMTRLWLGALWQVAGRVL
jgi:hypothetical protein